MNNYLSLASYNSQGSGPGRFEYISKLINENDFVLIQEHWLMECQFDLYSKHVNDINAHCVSAMPSNNINHGCPYGGCSILWKKSLNARVVY